MENLKKQLELILRMCAITIHTKKMNYNWFFLESEYQFLNVNAISFKKHKNTKTIADVLKLSKIILETYQNKILDNDEIETCISFPTYKGSKLIWDDSYINAEFFKVNENTTTHYTNEWKKRKSNSKENFFNVKRTNLSDIVFDEIKYLIEKIDYLVGHKHNSPYHTNDNLLEANTKISKFKLSEDAHNQIDS